MTGKPKIWSCISGCGACCKLDPIERYEALAVLSEQGKKQYLDLVGKDGWCKHYDKNRKICLIYQDRPDFCDVQNIVNTYGIQEGQENDFAIMCCKQQIRSIYGGRSIVMKKFLKQIKSPNE